MSEWQEYQCIEFSGLALNPCFSIYLFEISKGEKKFFYVGMTGDSHYPSARSILHRLAGHIDLGPNSKQSQFITALKNDVFGSKTITQEQLREINIKLHHFPIQGFKPWRSSFKELDKNHQDYKAYKTIQEKVLNLENKIISDFKLKLLNKTKGNSSINLKDDRLSNIYEQVNKIING